MPVHDDLGNRMKEYYEGIPKIKLYRRTPVIIRIDGKAFHSFTKGFKRPFDEVLRKSMKLTTKYLCENIQGCVLGYVQSDEISLLLIDYKKLNSSAWFDYEVQKVCSVSASMAAMRFNKEFGKCVEEFRSKFEIASDIPEDVRSNTFAYYRALDKGAVFDSRCFNIPREEVTNYFYWRQIDAIRNSVEMTGQAYFSSRALQNRSCDNIKEMLQHNFSVMWEDFPIDQKRGTCVVKVKEPHVGKDGIEVLRSKWVIDDSIPVFAGKCRDYIESLILPEE